MKRKIFFYALTAAVTLASCSEDPVDELSNSKIGLSVYMDSFKGSGGSRAIETGTDNFKDFKMTAFIEDRSNYMDNVSFSKTGNSWNSNDGSFFWPVGKSLNFYAYAPENPGKTGTMTINKDKQVLEGFSPQTAVSEQTDFVYANEYSGNTPGSTSYPTSIGLNFHHALSEITVSAKNENEAYTVKVSGVKIGNVISKGDLTLPYIGKREASWSLSSVFDTYTCSTSPVTLGASETKIGGSDATFMLIPQQLTKADKAASGAYIALQITATSNGRTTYSGWTYVGLDTNWKMGEHYNYTIDFSGGGGQDENGNNIELEDKMGANSYILWGGDNITIYPYARANTFWSNSDVGDASNVIGDDTQWEADVIWQDIPSRAINFCDASGKTLSGDTYSGTGKQPLYVKAATSTPGNVVVGVKKKGSADYLWSWHLWLTEHPSLVAGFMDRNLGATSATPADGSKTYGLYYQFGRKDPFVGSVDIYDINGTKIQTGATIGTGKVTFAKAVNTPGTFYTYGSSSPYDWASPNSYTSKNWNDITGASGKTFFDPCPPGWKLPEKSAYSAFSTSTFAWDATNKGRTYNTNWFPAAGFRYFTDGDVNDQGSFGYYWGSSPNDESYGYELYFYSGNVYPQNYVYRAIGQSVRCVQDN